MASTTALPAAVLILRLLTLALLAASLAVIATDKLTVDGDTDNPLKFTFKDVHAYRYVLSVAVIGCAYTLLQLPFAAVAVAQRKPLVGEGVAALLLVFTEVTFALLLAAGAAAGLGFTHDGKRIFDKVFGGDPDVDRFFDLAYASAGLMLAAAACTALIIILSIHALVK